MKTLISNFFILVIMAFFSSKTIGANYHFSQEIGNDSRSFTEAENPSTPWKSIQKLNSVFSSLKSGDKVLFRKGEVYYGTIIINNSGSLGNPITIGAYGNGELPVITSLVALKSWKSRGNGIFEATHNNFGAQPINLVVFNGINQAMGRFPNSDSSKKGYLNVDAHNGNQSVTDNSLSSSPNWIGGEVVIRKLYWILDRHKITAHSGSTIGYASISESPYEPKKDFGFFIQNHLGTLDQKGEWFYDTQSKNMNVYFGSESPSNSTVEVSTLDHLITQSGRISNIKIEHLSLRGANKNAINLSGGNDIIISNCKMDFSGENGIQAEGMDKLTITDSEILNSNNSGIQLKSSNNEIIKNNSIKNIQLIPGMGKSGDGNGFGIFSPNDNNLIEGNQIINSGYIGIRFGGNNSVVKNNFINHFNLTKNDGGGIYVYTGNNNTTYSNRKVIGNIILNGHGVREGTDLRSPLAKPQSEGIYLDDNTTGVEVAYNTVANISSKGVYLHNARQNNIHHNVVYNSTYQLYFKNDDMGADIRNNTVTDNLFFSKTPEQYNVNLLSISDDIDQMGNFDNNTYASPMMDNFRFINKYNMGSDNEVNSVFDLAGWQKAYGQDINSKVHPVNIPAYKINETIGENKFNNENFDSHANYISTKYGKHTWVNSSKLDGGAISITGTGSIETATNIGKVQKGKNYLIKFSGIGNQLIAGKIYFRQQNSPWQTISAINTVEFSKERGEYEVLISPASDWDDTVLQFKFENVSSGEIQMDNLSLYEVDLQMTDPDERILFEYNDGKIEKSIALDGEYVDMNNEVHTGSIKLAPFSSILLIKISESEIVVPAPIQEVKVIISENDSTILEGENVVIQVKVDEGKESEVEKIHYYFSETLIATQTENPFYCDWKDVPFGNHDVYVAAVDKQGRTVLSDTVTVQVNKQNVLPIVNIESPIKDTEIFEGETINIVGTAMDLDGEILEVGFYANEKLIGKVTENPYQYNWHNAPEGNHVLTISAKDNNQEISLSEPVGIKVVKNPEGELIPIESSSSEVLNSGYVLNVNLGTNQVATWESIDFEGEAVVSSQFTGRSYIYSNSNASENVLFQTERNGEAFQMEIPVANGTYTIKTYHNELYFGHKGPRAQKGRRVFDIVLEGQIVKANFDIFVENNNKPTVLTFEDIVVTDGKLQLGMKASSNRASISGLTILNSNTQNIQVDLPTLRFKSGHPEDVDYKGENYESDLKFVSYYGKSFTYRNAMASNEVLFQSERNAEQLTYAIPVENGIYTIKTYHNELWFGKGGPSAQKGRRVFDISLENNLVKKGFDLFEESQNQPVILTFEKVIVEDGVLNINMLASQNRATISAFSIMPESLLENSQPTTDFNLFLNTGGQQNESFQEVSFASETNVETYFNTPSYVYENNEASTEKLFQTERNSEILKYSIPVPNGTYTVYTMHNELWFGHQGPSAIAGSRVFDIFIQDTKVKGDFDLFSENDNQPTILTFENIEVKDGNLNIDLIASKNRASISGIAIVSNTSGNSSIQTQNLRGYREMSGRGYKEMIGRGYKEMDIWFDEAITEDAPEKINLFPNPARDVATLEVPTEIGEGRVLIHDMSGQLIRHFDLNWIRSTPNKFTIPLDNIAQGVYMISLAKDQNIVSRQRLIVNP